MCHNRQTFIIEFMCKYFIKSLKAEEIDDDTFIIVQQSEVTKNLVLCFNITMLCVHIFITGLTYGIWMFKKNEKYVFIFYYKHSNDLKDIIVMKVGLR